VIGWARHNLFSSWGNTLLTVVALYLVWRVAEGLAGWTIFHAVWSGDSGEACRVEGSGACWAFVRAYGRYPMPSAGGSIWCSPWRSPGLCR
jgi:general L-amino acid transport system permease protein